jgi:hypothetical protein
MTENASCQYCGQWHSTGKISDCYQNLLFLWIAVGVLAAVNIKFMVFWDVMLCSLTNRHWRFEGNPYIHLQDMVFSTLNMEARRGTETTVHIYQTTWCHVLNVLAINIWFFLLWCFAELCTTVGFLVLWSHLFLNKQIQEIITCILISCTLSQIQH